MKKTDQWLAAQAHESAVAGLNQRIVQLEDALAEIYHATDSTTGQMSIIEAVLPQKAGAILDSENEIGEARADSATSPKPPTQ